MRFELCDNCNLPGTEMLREVPVADPESRPAGARSMRICGPCVEALDPSDDSAFRARHENRPRVAGLP